MRNYSLFYLILVSILFISSCSSDDRFDVDESSSMSVSGIEVVTVKVSPNLRSSDSNNETETLLRFRDEVTLNNTKVLLDDMTKYEQADWLAKLQGFTSLSELYEYALDEAESYYERPGGYEEFKAKYPMLYYPEEGADYGAYLPIKDESLAVLSNENGHYMIGNEIIEGDVITDYSDLIEIGLADIGEILDYTEGEVIKDTISTLSSQLRAINYGDGTPIYAYHIKKHADWAGSKTKVGGDKHEHNTGWRKVGDGKKIKVTCGRITRPVYNLGVLPKGFKLDWHVEVSFRKRGFLGVWYNYSSATKIELVALYDKEPDVEATRKVLYSEGTSSHDLYVEAKCEHLIQPSDQSWGNLYDAEDKKQYYRQCLYRMYAYMVWVNVDYRGMSTPMNLMFMNSSDLFGYTDYISDKLYN